MSVFLSLGHARAVRDRIIEEADNWERESLEEIALAGPDWKLKLEEVKNDYFHQWQLHGCSGIPDCRYLNDFGDCVEFIAESERQAIHHTT